jgi:hypothetical protein
MDPGNDLWNGHSHGAHLWEENDRARYRRVLVWFIDGGSDGRGGHVDIC